MLDFLDEYVVDYHVTAAAKRAGYSTHTARTKGSEILALPSAQIWLKAKLLERQAERAAMEQRIIDEYERVAYFNIHEYLNFDGTVDLDAMPPEAKAAIASIKTNTRGEIKVTFHDKLTALGKLAMHTGKFNNKLELMGPGGGPIPLAQTGMTAAQAAELWQQQLAATGDE